ncbi:MAG TPA: YbbR-like domain-containing protein [Gemmatimonadaceae bacterium]
MPGTPQKTPSGLSRRIVELLTERLALKGAALFFALVLWLVASARQPSEQLVPVTLDLRLDSTLVLVSNPPQVRALVLGSARDVLNLYATPPTIRRTVEADTPDTLVMVLTPEDVQLPLGTEGQLRVRDVQPRSITLRFRSTMQRLLPVRSQLRFSGDSGWVVSGTPTIQPDSVLVSGPRVRVQRLENVQTVARDVVVRPGVSLDIPLDTSELGVSIQPRTVRVTVPVEPDTTRP